MLRSSNSVVYFEKLFVFKLLAYFPKREEKQCSITFSFPATVLQFMLFKLAYMTIALNLILSLGLAEAELAFGS